MTSECIPDDWLTVAQAAATLGLAVSTVYLQIAQGRIATVRVGQQHRISPAEIARYHRDDVGRAGWDKRPAPGYTPSRDATYSRRSRARRRTVGPDLNPRNVEARRTSRPDGTTVATVVEALHGDPTALASPHALAQRRYHDRKRTRAQVQQPDGPPGQEGR